jgi:hypothetical protein
MATLKCTDKGLQLIQTALDFYSRVGILQLDRILEHPTVESLLREQFRPKEVLKIGSQTERGEITKITKKSIWTKGSWGNGEEVRKWDDVENIKLSVDYSKYHAKQDEIKDLLIQVNSIIYNKPMTRNISLGIYNEQVDESCRESFEIIQKIRHQFWLANPSRSNITVDSTDGRNNNIIVKLDESKINF